MVKKNSKIYLSIAIFLILIVGLIIFLNIYNYNSKVINIGATLPLSGKYAYYGEVMNNGYELALEDINDSRINLIVEDNKGDSVEAVNNVNKLINLDGSEIILSAFTHITSAIKGHTKGKILYYLSTSPTFAKEDSLTFRDYYDASDSGKMIANSVSDAGHTKVSFLSEISDQCNIFRDAFFEKSQELGIEVKYKGEYELGTKDLKTDLLKLKLNEVDSLVLCSWRHEQILMKQLKELGFINTPTFHWVAPFLPVADTSEMRELYKENNAISTWYAPRGNLSEKQLNFENRYFEKYGKIPAPESAYAYDSLIVLEKALKNCEYDIQDKKCISNQILNTNYEGVAGHLEFDEEGVSKRKIFLIALKNGDWREI